MSLWDRISTSLAAALYGQRRETRTLNVVASNEKFQESRKKKSPFSKIRMQETKVDDVYLQSFGSINLP